MRMQPLLAYWLHSEVDEGAQEKRSLLSTHTYSLLLTSTDLYSIDEVAAQDKEGAIGSRQLSYDASREGFTWGQVVQWTLQRGDLCLCSCECGPAEDLCVIAIFAQGSMEEVLRIGTPPWLQSVVGCRKRFYGCTSQMAWHGNETSMIYRVSQKCTNRTKL